MNIFRNSILVLITSTLPLISHAETFVLAVTGSSYNLGDFNGVPLGTVVNGVSKQMNAKNGKESKKNTTSVTRSRFIAGEDCLQSEGGVGVTLIYVSSDAISTQENGDLLVAKLDRGAENIACLDTTTGFSEVKLSRLITGGTGDLSEACGYVDFEGTAQVVGDGTISIVSGTNTVEVFLDPADGAGIGSCPPL